MRDEFNEEEEVDYGPGGPLSPSMAVVPQREKYRKKGLPLGEYQYEPDDVAEVIKGTNGIKSNACIILGCSRTTLDRYINNFPQVKEAYEETRERTIDMVENKLLQGIAEGNTAMTIFFLKTQAKDRGYVEREERQVQQQQVISVIDMDTDEI